MLAKTTIGTLLSYLALHLPPAPNPHSPRASTQLLILNLCILPYFYIFPFAQLYLPLPVVHTLATSSIAISYVLDYVMNGARVSRWGVVGVGLAVFGVGLMVNNRVIGVWLGDGDGFQTRFGNYRDRGVWYGCGVGLGLFAARVAYTYAMVSVKKFPQISTFELNFYNNLLGVFTGAIGYMQQ